MSHLRIAQMERWYLRRVPRSSSGSTDVYKRQPLEEVFETYRNTDSDFLMIEMHDAMETLSLIHI